MAAAVGEIGETCRHITQELERTWREAQWAHNNMYTMFLGLRDKLMNFWNNCPMYVEKVENSYNVLEEVPEE